MIFSAGLLLVTCGIVFITVLLVKVFNYKQQAKCKVNALQDDSSPAAVVEPEVLIVGAGVVGSALAAVLGREGRNVVLMERDMSEPDRILGELLQPGGFHALQELGLEAALDGIEAEAMHGYVVHDLHTGSNVVLHYPKDAEGRVQAGRAFHHGRFIAGLRREAQKQETVTVIEATATRLIEEHGVIVGVQYKAKDGEGTQHLRASLTIVADGCFSRLRRSLVNESAVVSSHFVGVLMESCPQFQWNHAEIVLANPSPVLIYKVCPRYTRILVDVPGQPSKDMRCHLLERILPQLPPHIRGAFEDAVQYGKLRSMPNSYLPPAATEKPGVIILGDAFNMRHPITGGGMSVALNDVITWRDLLRDMGNLGDRVAVTQAVRSFRVRRMRNHSFVVNVMAQALYALFAADGDDLVCLRQACYSYFKLGGVCVSGPMDLLSVLRPRPLVLISHFFAVALYATWCCIRAEGPAMLPRRVWRAGRVFTSACGVIYPLVCSELKTLV